MVTQYGMGTELMSKQIPTDDYSMSESTRRMVDEEQQYVTDLAHRRALALVGENRALLEDLASTLLANEVLERDDIDRIMSSYRGENGSDPTLTGEPGAATIAASEGLPDDH